MSILTATALSKHFGAQDVFNDVSLQIGRGDRVGLVGANGTGKTTLLRVLTGLEAPSSGQVQRARGVRLGYLPQEATLLHLDVSLWQLAEGAFSDLHRQAVELRRMEELIAAASDQAERDDLLTRYGQAQHTFELAGGYTYERRIRQVLNGLGFGEHEYHLPIVQLSGGQQTRVQLARLLLEQPDLLLLDEPTNHLDLEAVEWLEDFLQDWPGAMIIVAHDRYLLDKVVNKIWELDRGRLQVFRGNYSAYLQQRAEQRESQRRAFLRQQAHLAQEEEFIRRNLAGQRTKEAQGRRKRLERLERIEAVSHEAHIRLDLPSKLRSGDLVLATHGLVVGFRPEAPLFVCPDVEIRRGDRVALLGPNGAGKTTFIRTILKEIKPLAGRVRIGAAVELGYFAQAHAGLRTDWSVLDEILAVRNLPLNEARRFLARFLFVGDDVFKSVGNLSGGERARLALAKLALQGANFLILDEPTNHLDIPSREILQTVLRDYPGTVLLVSHDRYFVEALANQVWSLEDGRLQVSRGGYDAYLAARQARRAKISSKAVNTNWPDPGQRRRSGRATSSSGSTPRPGQFRRQQAIAELEQAIQAAQTRLAELTVALEEASQAQAVERIRELGQDYQTVEQQLGNLLEEWAELEAA